MRPPTAQKSVSASGGKEAGGSFGRPTTQGRAAQTALQVMHCTIPELDGWAALRVTRPQDSGWQGACREAWLRGGWGGGQGSRGLVFRQRRWTRPLLRPRESPPCRRCCRRDCRRWGRSDLPHGRESEAQQAGLWRGRPRAGGQHGGRLLSPSGGLQLWPQRSRRYRRAGPASRAPTASEKRGRNPNGVPATSAPTSPAEASTGFRAGSKDEPELGLAHPSRPVCFLRSAPGCSSVSSGPAHLRHVVTHRPSRPVQAAGARMCVTCRSPPRAPARSPHCGSDVWGRHLRCRRTPSSR